MAYETYRVEDVEYYSVVMRRAIRLPDQIALDQKWYHVARLGSAWQCFP